MARTARGRTITSRVRPIVRVGPVGLFPSLLCVLCFTQGQSHAQCEYAVTVIKPPECQIFGAPPTFGRGINELGQIAGSHWQCDSWGDDAAFLWTAETGIVILDMPAGTFDSFAVDVNDAGQVVGTFDDADDEFSILAYVSQGNQLTVIPPPAGTFSRAFAISSIGLVVGVTADATSFYKAFVWEKGLMTLILPTFGPRSIALDVNEIGQVVGWMGTTGGLDSHAFMWQVGVVTDIGLAPGTFTSRATAINNLGHMTIAGHIPSKAGNVLRSFLWVDGEFTDLGVLPGFDATYAYDINDFNQVVGRCDNQSDTTAFIWQNGVMTELTALVPDESINVTLADAINNAGQIAATGDDGVAGAALLLTPIQSCPGDLDCDGFVGITDFLGLLAAWGPQPNHPADLNNDGTVGIVDFLMLLGSWGPCL